MKPLIRYSISIVIALLFSFASNVAQDCVVPDNGTGTITLPPMGCQYTSPDEVFMIIDGLPPGTTIELNPLYHNFSCCNPPCPQCTLPLGPGECETIGGNLGGYGHCFTGTMEFIVTGTGQLSGFNRLLTLELFAEVHTGPRNPGDPVQTFPTELFRLQGQLYGDPDFCTLNVIGGTDFGLLSPGNTTLTQLPSGDFNVDSFFDITYQIEFEGCPGSPLDGYMGTTTATIRMETGEPFVPTSDPLFAGEDQFTSPCGLIGFGPNSDYPILPEGFFGPGSDPFDGIIALKGQPSEGSQLPLSDVIVSRNGEATFESPYPSTQLVETEIVELHLQSTEPIIVTYNGGPDSFFDVFVEIDIPEPGNTNITKLDDFGGEFEYILSLNPIITFVEQGTLSTAIFDPGAWGISPLTFTSSDANLWTLSPIEGEFDVVTDERVRLQTEAGGFIELLPLPKRYRKLFCFR